MSEKTSTEKNTTIQEESEQQESEKQESEKQESEKEESEKEESEKDPSNRTTSEKDSEDVSLKQNVESVSGNQNSKAPVQAFEHLVQVYNEKGPLSRKERIKILKNLRKTLKKNKDEIITTISSDFGCRSSYETLSAEIFITCKGIKYNLLYMDEWMESEYPEVDWLFWPAGIEVQKQPLGVVGIIAPWNYPLQLAILPLVAAISAGNRVLLKPSEHTSKTSLLLQKLLHESCGDEVVQVVLGDAVVAQEFSSLPLHHLFFTGSTAVGKMVMRSAAYNLTPVTLELGGKSPAIIHETFSISRAADRIASGKMFNAGQTCIATDYILCPEAKVDELVEALKKVIERGYPTLEKNDEYTSIINDRQRMRLQGLLDDASTKGATLIPINPNKEEFATKMQPYILTKVTDDMEVMKEEIFGPILPIVPYKEIDEAIAYVNKRDRPLALYYFDNKTSRIREVLRRTVSGGVCVNDTILHVSQENLPFGGVGHSGMGAYHGKYGFDAFTHQKSIFIQSRFALTPYLTRSPISGWVRKLLSFLS
jgi:coniferyl-aldehyde dehydrogenase